ncbi:MAG: hypothetical protein LCH32_00875 [Bacteroidetes bacterium]|nr:hypothetical protein [Bacteroidota bacterium]
MASIKKILLGLGIGGGLVAGGTYLWRLNKTSVNLEVVPSVKLHKLDLQGIVLRVDVQLKNPTRTSLKLKFPFIKLLIKGSSIGSSQSVNQDIALPAFGEAKFEAIMIRIPMFSLLSSAKSLLQAVQQGEAFKIGVMTMTTIDLGFKKVPYEKTDEVQLIGAQNGSNKKTED